MITYIINFILCSGLLLLVYRLFLQGEQMYRFNRFYLLFSLVFSLLVPAISITTHTNTIPAVYQQVVTEAFTPDTVDAPFSQQVTAPVVAPTHNYLPLILVLLYGTVFAAMLYRFVINLYRISQAVKASDQIDHQQIRLILTAENVTPHSFLKYIFINRDDYRDGIVEPEIICHEQTHIRQYHSLDVLFVELLQVIFWFNPFIPFYRRAIRLNHEFLADEAVVQAYHNTLAYQSLLLAKACHGSSLQLSSPFNYQTIKKRLIMMTKTTSAKMAAAKKMTVVTFIALAVFLFSQKTEASLLPTLLPQTKPQQVTTKTDTSLKLLKPPPPAPRLKESMRVKYAAVDAPQSVLDAFGEILKKYGIPQRGAEVSPADKEKLEALYVQMSKKQQDRQSIAFGKAALPLTKNTVSATQMEKWKDKDYFVRIDNKNKKIESEDLSKYKPEDFDRASVSPAGEWARVHNGGIKYFVDLMTKPYFANYNKKIMADRSDVLWEYPQTSSKPKVDQVRFPPPVVKPDAKSPKPKVDQVRFPPPVVRPDTAKHKTTTSASAGNVAAQAGQPLLVVDGVPFDKAVPPGFNFKNATGPAYGKLLSINPEEITDISVLKSEAAVKLWGDRGANGVLIITTKNAKKQ